MFIGTNAEGWKKKQESVIQLAIAFHLATQGSVGLVFLVISSHSLQLRTSAKATHGANGTATYLVNQNN